MKPSTTTAQSPQQAKKRPLHPRLVLLIAILLPGVGQVVNGVPLRGLLMLFFTLTLAVVCYHLTTPQHSILGRFAGGWFVYSISVLDAYKWARYRWEYFKAQNPRQ